MAASTRRPRGVHASKAPKMGRNGLEGSMGSPNGGSPCLGSKSRKEWLGGEPARLYQLASRSGIVPGKPASRTYGLLSMDCGLLDGIVGCHFGLLGFPGRGEDALWSLHDGPPFESSWRLDILLILLESRSTAAPITRRMSESRRSKLGPSHVP